MSIKILLNARRDKQGHDELKAIQDLHSASGSAGGTADREHREPRKDLSLEVLLTEPSLAAQIPINLQTPNPNPPVDGDVLHHLLSVCILQRDAPWRHCQNHLLKLASSNPCLAVEKKKKNQQSLQTWKGFSPHPLCWKEPHRLCTVSLIWIFAAKAPAVGMGQQSLAKSGMSCT